MRCKYPATRLITSKFWFFCQKIQRISVQNHRLSAGSGQKRLQFLQSFRGLAKPRPCCQHIRPGRSLFHRLCPAVFQHRFRNHTLKDLPVFRHCGNPHHSAAGAKSCLCCQVSGSAHIFASRQQQHFAKSPFISSLRPFRDPGHLFLCQKMHHRLSGKLLCSVDANVRHCNFSRIGSPRI